MHKPIIHLIAAARPNFMKIAPLFHALKVEDWCQVQIVHTGQHYDANMSSSIFADLKLDQPDIHLGVGSGTHAEQTGKVMMAYEKICLETQRPDFLVVVGDVNSTAACALVGSKLHIPVAHLEAGLRSRDRSMPEEINRLVADAVSDYFWTPSPDADANLLEEGHPADRIIRVGNIMIDSYELMKDEITKYNSPAAFGLNDDNYGIVTLHRPANVDNPETLGIIINQLINASKEIVLVFSVHPRTKSSLLKYDLWNTLQSAENINVVEPISYIPFMSLVKSAKLIITDSGGIQEETTYLNVPCLTLRENTERPITITQGTNRLVEPIQLEEKIGDVLIGRWPTATVPELWDGKTAGRIVEHLKLLVT